MAAGEAIGLLADAFPHHSVQDVADHAVRCGVDPAVVAQHVASGRAAAGSSLQGFSLQRVLERGTPLLASGGQVGGGAGGKGGGWVMDDGEGCGWDKGGGGSGVR